SPDFTNIRVSEPSTCGWMLAERRDFTVATYSSTRGTGARFTVSVFTGSGRAAGSLASVLLHPEVVSTSTPTNARVKMTESFFNLIFIPNTGAEIEMPSVQSRIHHLCR